MIKKSLLIWSLIIPLAILNGIIREKVLVPLLGANNALPISGVSLCLLIFILSVIAIPRLGRTDLRTYVMMGLVWVVFTLTFECVFGLFVMGKSYSELIRAYDITTGNLWLLVVLFTAVSPLLSARITRIL